MITRPDLLASLCAFALVGTLSQDATLLATSSGALFGLHRSIPLLLGLATGLASLVAAASLGLGTLL